MRSTEFARWPVAAAAVVVSVCACSGSDRTDLTRGAPGNVIVHPEPDRLLSSAPGIHLMHVPGTGGAASVPGLEGLRIFDAAEAIGEADGDAELTFGTIAAAAVLSDGRLALADREYGLIRLLGTASPKRLGGLGDGPGEFVRPIGVAEDDTGGLLVLNSTRGDLRLERFRRAAEDFEFERRVSLQLVPLDGGSALCVADGRVYVTGMLVANEERTGQQRREDALASRRIVHELGGEGDVLFSFAEPYGPPPERRSGRSTSAEYAGAVEVDLVRHLGSARLACDAGDGGRVWVAFSELGEVHLHTAAGDLLWIARLGDFESPRLYEIAYEYGTSLGGDPNQTFPIVRDRISDVSLISDDVLVVQVTRTRTERDRKRDFSYRTYLLQARSGTLLDGFSADHRIMSGNRSNAVLYREALHPQVIVTSLGPRT